MALERTVEEKMREILDVMAGRHLLAGHSVRRLSIDMALHPRVQQLDPAYAQMVAEGLITFEKGGAFLKLTEAGFSRM